MATLKIEQFPDDLLRAVKSNAALQGVTLREAVIQALEGNSPPKESAKRIKASIQAFVPRAPEQKAAKP